MPLAAALCSVADACWLQVLQNYKQSLRVRDWDEALMEMVGTRCRAFGRAFRVTCGVRPTLNPWTTAGTFPRSHVLVGPLALLSSGGLTPCLQS